MNDLPLQGLRIVVTRSKKQAAGLFSKFKDLGAEVYEFPVISITAPDSWAPLDEAIEKIKKYDWVLFASANAVDAFVARSAQVGIGKEELDFTKFAVIGPGTASALEEYGIKASFCPSTFIAETLVAEFPDYPNLQGKRILWPRTNVGRPYVLDRMTEAGAKVDVVEAYHTSLPANEQEIAERLTTLLWKNVVDVITLASAQSARNLKTILTSGINKKLGDKNFEVPIGMDSITYALEGVVIATIGPETSAAARKHLGRVDIEAKVFTIDGLVEAIVKGVQKD
jgi:uroporphyrinogen III methyltransferase/synthase